MYDPVRPTERQVARGPTGLVCLSFLWSSLSCSKGVGLKRLADNFEFSAKHHRSDGLAEHSRLLPNARQYQSGHGTGGHAIKQLE